MFICLFIHCWIIGASPRWVMRLQFAIWSFCTYALVKKPKNVQKVLYSMSQKQKQKTKNNGWWDMKYWYWLLKTTPLITISRETYQSLNIKEIRKISLVNFYQIFFFLIYVQRTQSQNLNQWQRVKKRGR